MSLVDDEHVVLGQQLASLERVDGHERVVGDDDVDVTRGRPGPLDEALGDHRAALPEALLRAHRHLSPGPLRDPRHQLVAVTGLGLAGPRPQPHDLLPEPRRLAVDVAHGEQRALVVVREATLELVGAHVVAPALDERVGGAAAEHGFEGVREPRHVAVDDLRLERERGRRDDGRAPALDRVLHRGHEVGERLAGARAGLDQQVLAGGDGVGDGVRHLHLTGALGAADARDRCVEEVVERGHPSSSRRCAPAGRDARPQGVRAAWRGALVPRWARDPQRRDTDPFPSDIEIAEAAEIQPVVDLARERLGIPAEALIPYGHTKAKVSLPYLDSLADRPDGRLVLVTAMSPTPAGEGKTTTSVGLADALSRLGHDAMVALREPSMGPVFGIKGGAAGGGYAQVVPMTDINLHFTGDFAAIAAANNLLAALLDNHLHHGNALDIDSRTVTWKRVVDLNDRALRDVVIGLGGPLNGVPAPGRLRHHRRLRGDGDLLPRPTPSPTSSAGSATSSSRTPTASGRSPPATSRRTAR